MATIIVPDCPVCGKPMRSNAEAKQKNPKAPDWKCTDQNCKFQYNNQSKTWVVSEYITSVWEDVPQGTKNAPQRNFESQERRMEKAVAHKDEQIAYTASITAAYHIVTAEMSKDIETWDDQRIKERLAYWQKYMHEKYKAPFYSI